LHLLLQIPFYREKELDKDFAVFLKTISVAPEKCFLVLGQLLEIRVGLNLINLSLLNSIGFELGG